MITEIHTVTISRGREVTVYGGHAPDHDGLPVVIIDCDVEGWSTRIDAPGALRVAQLIRGELFPHTLFELDVDRMERVECKDHVDGFQVGRMRVKCTPADGRLIADLLERVVAELNERRGR